MPISVTCPGCDKRLSAKDSLAGRTVACPHCGQRLTLPSREDDAAAYLLKSEVPATTEASGPGFADNGPMESPAAPPRRPRKSIAALPPLQSRETPLWLRHLHWLLILALIPLTISLLQKGEEKELGDRLAETLERLPPEVRQRVNRVVDELDDGKGSIDDLYAALPEHKLAGAALPRHSWFHWIFAAASAMLFMAFFLFLATDGSADPWHLAGLALFTATAGILFLTLVQVIAVWSEGRWFYGHGLIVLILYLFKFIGFSYQAALDPSNGFLLSFLGFTLGVGFCEEACKAMPLVWHFSRRSPLRWRGAFLWGLASGVGFGVSEGISYASDFYNGFSGPGVYYVRFLSCVALHALWSGSAAITVFRRQYWLQEKKDWFGYLATVFAMVAVPMVLHGLYDTLLKKQMNGGALAVAVCSFLYLAFQISRLNSVDDNKAQQALLREYRKRRAAMS